MLPVFGGISGSMRTTLNISECRHPERSESEVEEPRGESRMLIRDPSIPLRSARDDLQLARDELLQLHDIRRKLADAFRRFLRRHRIVVEQISEFFLVHLEPLDVRALRLFRIELALH